MIDRLKKYLSVVAVVSMLFVVASVNSYAAGALPGGASGATSNGASKEACSGLTDLGIDCDPAGDSTSIAAGPVSAVVNLFSIVVGIASVVMIIYGGFRFVTSGGNSDATKSARSTILYACVGLATVILAKTIVYFVFSKATKVAS